MSLSDKKGIAIFASGAGSNALKIIEHFAEHAEIHVNAVICNNPGAGVLGHAFRHHIPTLLITKKLLNDEQWFLRQLEAHQVDHIVLAGFLLLIPEYLVKKYPDRIINIHPALLPKYGGKGMYGKHVHEAVKQSGDKETGITIHLADSEYDQGRILYQQKVAVTTNDTPDTISEKVHVLEHAWYPKVIEEWITMNRH